MVMYTIQEGVLEITGSGAYASAEWDAVLEAVRNDPFAPDGAPLIIDSRAMQIAMSSVRLIDRIRNLRARLGPKMGSACAMVVSPENVFISQQFQSFSEELINLRVGIFTDKSEARRWLLAGEPAVRR